MTGPENYVTAEVLLGGVIPMNNSETIAAAQVWATLALAAATAHSYPSGEWQEVVSPEAQPPTSVEPAL